MSKEKRFRQITIKEGFFLNKKPKIVASSMEKNLRDLMAAAAEKRLGTTKSENVTNVSRIRDPVENIKREMKHSDMIERFQKYMKILPSGRYEVALPFKIEGQLRDNRGLAL
ncbi:hypothetical protein TNIN_301451 [Trichonephila inaurata madagascariensis]|uniref:Uncharacterized protein n=1 Tax=Trichonephila inaurata madagascariensis TaxID=2747483 RepID=A0A8X6MH77_9ARAC|nr:hypothetical protein TNIN_301451 [Trichonephila inaurata madagascariensis]